MDEFEILPSEDIKIQELQINIPEGLDVHLLEEAIYRAFRGVEYERKGWEYGGKFYGPHQVLWVTDLPFCKRRTVYEYHAGQRERDTKGKVRMTLGSVLHEFITNRLKAGGEREKLVVKDYFGRYLLRGKVDYLMPNAVVEFKLTIRQGELPQKPETYYTDQLQLYFWLTERTKGYLVVINAYTGEIKCHEVDRDEERIKTLLAKGLEIVNGFTTMTLPEPEPIYEWLCSDCPETRCPYKTKM